MKSRIGKFVLLMATATLVHAHFVFVVPEAGAEKAKVFISEELKPAAEVDLSIIKDAKLSLLNSSGHDTELVLTKSSDSYIVQLSGQGTRVIHGTVDLGFTQSRGPKAYLLLYYPKTILGNAFNSQTILTEQTPIQIVPTGKAGALTLQLLAHGKPVPNAEITVILPDSRQKKLKTDEKGQTEVLSQTGRYGAWARFWEPATGERDGKKYEELRNYATLVFDALAATETAKDSSVTAKQYALLPEPTSSFGSVVNDGWLYIYGGHIAPTHSYSTAAVSGQFNRLRLSGKPEWERLPGGQAMQGMNLAAFNGKIYRVGGMVPHNTPGTPSDNHSVADCARFDPATQKWDALPALPENRSSHDVVVIGSKLIVAGGWAIDGDHNDWAKTVVTLDLATPNSHWESVPQPFQRRALMAVAYDGKMYVIGGFDEKNQIVREVSIYDPQTQQWSEGPKIPAGPGLSFAPAAGTHNGDLYVSVSDGTLYRLGRSAQEWEKVGKSTPRLAHRIAFANQAVLVIGGANKGKNSDLVEAVPIQ